MQEIQGFEIDSREMGEVWMPDGSARAWTTLKGDGELHYQNQTGKQWSVEVDLTFFHLRGFSISNDGRFVVIRTGYHSGIDAEENLEAYDMDGQCIYSVFPPEGTYFAENATQIIADLLATGDPDGVLVEKNIGLVHSINYYKYSADQVINAVLSLKEDGHSKA